MYYDLHPASIKMSPLLLSLSSLSFSFPQSLFFYWIALKVSLSSRLIWLRASYDIIKMLSLFKTYRSCSKIFTWLIWSKTQPNLHILTLQRNIITLLIPHRRAVFTCSRVLCLVRVSLSSFSIFLISLLTWYSCSFSRVCSSSTFSCLN